MFDTELMLKRGFTLIELLIVIAVLGILAVAVISAINPIEQINRSYDTGSQSDSEQLISAIDRYYAAQQGVYPWQRTTADTVTVNWQQVTSSWNDLGGASVLSKLSETSTAGTGELKQAFITKISGAKNPLFLHNDGNPGDSNYVCFKAISNSFKTAAKTRCDATSGIPSDLISQKATICNATGNIYYSCLP